MTSGGLAKNASVRFLETGSYFERGEVSMPPFFVQLRFPMEGRWVTVAVADSRGVAAAYAGAAFRHARSDDGYHADCVRIVTEEQLRVLSGLSGLREARATAAEQSVGGSDS
jgi:hypothetical protein